MRESTIFTIMAFLAAIFVLATSASALCSSCSKEADWSETASAFIAGKAMSDEPPAFGPKVARAESSQFEKGTPAAQSAAENDLAKIALQSINSTPGQINSTGKARITAVFALNGTERQDQGEMRLSAHASIKNSTGAEVAKLILIRQSANQYSNDWIASVPPGIYSLDLVASSLEGVASFKDALQIEVV